MTVNELHTKIVAAKRFLNSEVVKIRTTEEPSMLGFREIGDRLDLIHEVERIGIRNLGERDNRRIVRMLTDLDTYQTSNN